MILLVVDTQNASFTDRLYEYNKVKTYDNPYF